MKKQQKKGVKRPLSSRSGLNTDGAAMVTSDRDNTNVKGHTMPTVKSELSTAETCDLIAELSETILESPEHAFSSSSDEDVNGAERVVLKGPSKIHQLLTIAGQQSSDSEQYTAQLAIMSLLAIFIDILPAYRIRVPTAQEMAVKVSKETKQMWDYERSLLQHYQLYLKLLEKTWDKHKQGNGGCVSAVSVAALVSLAELLKKAFHFNFRSNLLTVVVRHMNNRQSEAVRAACCGAISHVFEHDAQGDVALEAARLVAKLIKDRNLKIHVAALESTRR
jgi:nucleolar complex protein 3